MINRSLLLLVLVVGAVFYGSLFPFEFHAAGSAHDAVVHFFSTWRQLPQSRGDLLANLLFYVPLGLTLGLWLRPRVSTLVLIGISAAVGGLLSTAMEIAQFFDAGRVSCMSDLYLNTLGCCVGAVGATLVQGRLVHMNITLTSDSRFVALLLLAWLGWRLFPFEPTIDLHKYWSSLKPLFETPSLSTFDLFRFTVMWACAGYLARRGLNLFRSLELLGMGLLCVLLLKILIIGLVITLPEILGLALGIFFLQFESRLDSTISIRLLTGLLVVFIVMERLQPWHFALFGHPFEWIPLYGFLHGSIQVDILSFLQKFFFYGTLLWFLVRTGIRPSYAIIFECSLLFATSIAQTHLPHRSGEIGDSVLAGLVGLIYVLTSRHGAQRPNWLMRGR